MKKLDIVTLSDPGQPWSTWIAALDKAGFETRIFDWEHIVSVSGGVVNKTVLVDGLLPRLSRLIQAIAAHRPDAHIIVATEKSSFVVYNESLQFGATYISDIESDEHFVDSFRKAITSSGDAPGGVLPNWISP